MKIQFINVKTKKLTLGRISRNDQTTNFKSKRWKFVGCSFFHTLYLFLFFNVFFCSFSNAQFSPRRRWWQDGISRMSNMGRILMGEDPLVLSGKYEGDILTARSDTYKQEAEEKNAVAKKTLLWPGGIIPYEFSTGYQALPFERFLITRAMKDIERNSCVKFVKRKKEYDYVNIVFDSYKCYSNVGRRGGRQVLSLGVFCVTFYDRGNVYHELLHVLGFHHEHNRPDRDHYVKVEWKNIRSGAEMNFERRDHNNVDLLGLPYDIDSVMHYSPHAFSKIHYLLPTIVSHDRGIFFTRSKWPSKLDYAKLMRLYRCRRKKHH